MSDTVKYEWREAGSGKMICPFCQSRVGAGKGHRCKYRRGIIRVPSHGLRVEITSESSASTPTGATP